MRKLIFAILILGICACSKDSFTLLGDYPFTAESNAADMVAPEEGGDKFEEYEDNPFIKTADKNVSTFSVDSDGASYAVMRKYISQEYVPNPSSVRIEEFLNYFTFDYPEPEGDHQVAINSEIGPCPWAPEHRLLRLGIKGRTIPEAELPASNFVFLVDVSGSMNSNDKLPLLKTSLETMVDYLRPEDRISLITYSGSVKKVLESTPASESAKIKSAIRKLSSGGSTAGGAALEMAYNEALANFIIGGNNRVIMGTDGDFNVGVTSSEALTELVSGYADKGIYLTVCGFGSGNLNDAMMESISNRGNGTYEYIDNEAELTKVFVNEKSEFFAVANDAKIQITFDPAMVESYRLIGYENRLLSKEDFEDDKKDAGEIGSGQTITALYEIVPADGYAADAVCGTFDFRYKKSLDSASVPLSVDFAASSGDVKASSSELKASDNLSFAAGIAAYGMLLRESPYKGEATYQMAKELAQSGLSYDPYGYRTELISLIDKAFLIMPN